MTSNQELACLITLNDIDKIEGALLRVNYRICEYGSNEKILHDLKGLKVRIELLIFTLSTEKGNK